MTDVSENLISAIVLKYPSVFNIVDCTVQHPHNSSIRNVLNRKSGWDAGYLVSILVNVTVGRWLSNTVLIRYFHSRLNTFRGKMSDLY